MGHLTFILMFPCFVSCNIFVTAEGLSNLTILRSQYKTYCVAKGEDVFSALTWNSVTDPSVLREAFTGSRTYLNVIGWTPTNSLEHFEIDHQVTDFRWNDLIIRSTNGENNFNHTNKIPIKYQNNIWKLTVSVLAEKDVYFYLCDDSGDQPYDSKCYWIILGGWISAKDPIGKSALRRCRNGAHKPVQGWGTGHCEGIRSYDNGIINLNEWSQVTFVVDTTTTGRLTLHVLHKDMEIMKYTDYKPFNLHYLNFRSHDHTAYFRIHDYSYHLGQNGIKLESDFFQPKEKQPCLDIVYSYNQEQVHTILEIYVNYRSRKTKLVGRLESTQGKWKYEKVHFALDEDFGSGIKVILNGTNGNVFAVGYIGPCSFFGNRRISTILLNGRKLPDLKCQSLKYPGQNVALSKPDETLEGYGDEGALSCKAFLTSQEISNCQSVTICNLNRDKHNVCFCSSGFYTYYPQQECVYQCGQYAYGLNCKHRCGHCKYGYSYGYDCDKASGKCPYGCEEDYSPPLCQVREGQFLILKYPPEVVSSTPTSITVTISNFETTNKVNTAKECILQYTSLTKASDENSWKEHATFNYNAAKEFTVNGLEPDIEYAFRVILVDDHGNKYTGDKVHYSSGITSCDMIRSDAIAVHSSNTSVEVNWKVPLTEKYPCNVTSYKFMVGKQEAKVSTNQQELTFKVEQLMPYTNYTWRLLYRNTEIVKDQIRTLEGVPSVVESLNIQPLGETGLSLKWQKPQYPNGEIKVYRVTYKHTQYLSCPEVERHSEENHEDTQDLFLDLKDLKPYSSYYITIAASTFDFGKKLGKMANTAGFSILKLQLVTDPSQPLKVGPGSAEIFWKTPRDCSTIQGFLKGYEVTVQGRSEWVISSVQKWTVESHLSSKRLEPLLPYTEYTVNVLPLGRGGRSDAQYGLSTNFKTRPAAPRKVENAVPYSFNGSRILMKWTPPYPPTGELEYYQLQIEGKERTVKVGTTNYCKLWERMICGKYEGLEENKKYIIKVLAKNKDVDILGEASSFPVITKEQAPDSPENVEAIALSPQEIKVTWEHPYVTRGNLKYFQVQVKLISTGLKNNRDISYDKTHNLTVEHPKKNYLLEVKDLQPSSEYEVYIFAVTVFRGKSNTTFVKTSIYVPDFRSDLQLKPESKTNTSFEIIIPSANVDLLTQKSSYIIIVTSVEDAENHNRKLEFKDKAVEEEILKEIDTDKEKISWIAAELEPINEERTFKVGENTNHSVGRHFVESTTNPALVPGLYKVTLIAICEWENKIQHRTATIQLVVGSSDHTTNAGNIVGWIILVLLLISIPVVLFYILKRRKFRKAGDMIELKREDMLSGSRGVSVDGISKSLELEVSPEVSPAPMQPVSQRFSQRVAINDLEQYIKQGLASGELKRQHSLFPRGQTRPWEYAQLLQNKSKNRYGNLLAYDGTRVKLAKLPDDPFSDYINANYIDGYKSPKFYIATQGPKRNTVTDFWRMIWQEQVQVIAMLTNVFESGKLKCEKYWPGHGQEVTYEDFTILNASNQIFADYTFRIFNVTRLGKTRKIHHLHFTSWPDHGVPLYPQSVASYLKKLLATPPGSGPILVHCSAGVGRTGTIVLADICLRMAASEGCIDALGFLQQIREQRANMVDTLEQYKLVHLVLLECLVLEPSSYPCDASFENHVKELSTSGAIERQFKRLHERKWQDLALKFSSPDQVSSPAQWDMSKNRNLNIIPGSNGRVYISPFPAYQQQTDYINAVYVDGFRAKDQFVVTQFPLQSTVADFWRMINEKKISLVVVLNEINREDKTVCNFWPQDLTESMQPVPTLTVTKKSEDDTADWTTHTLNLISKSTSNTESKTLRILHLKGWRGEEILPPSPDVIIELWQEAERLYKGKEPITVCCLDGSTSCGYFVALAFLIEKIKLEQQCDVCQAVRTVRQNREQFVPSCEQFEYLYKAAVTYLDSFQTYANFS